MAKLVARNVSLYVEDSTSACQALSGFSNNLTLTYEAEGLEATTLGNVSRQRLPDGLKDWSLTFDGHYATGANETDAVLYGIAGGSTVCHVGPAGSSIDDILYSACSVLSNYETTFSLADAGQINVEMVSRSGSLTRGTWFDLIGGTQGPLSAGLGITACTGVAWTGPTSVYTNDTNRASAAVSSPNQYTAQLRATNFGFSVPVTATIIGVLAEVDCYYSGPYEADFAYLIKGGSVQTTVYSSSGWSTDEGYMIYGASNLLWGTTLTSTNVNASDFGVSIRAFGDTEFNPMIAYIDHIRMTVYYTDA